MAILILDGHPVEYTQTGPSGTSSVTSLVTSLVTSATANHAPSPDLLLVHSLLTELTVFEKVLPALAADRRVTCINLPGFGASTALTLDGLEAQADHVARVMAALKLPANTAVFGNGFGAFDTLQLAIRHGAQFGNLIVADCVPAFPEAARVPFRGMAGKVNETGMGAVLDTAIGRMFPPAFQAAHPEVIADRKAKLGKVDAGCFGRACLALAGMDLTPLLPSIRNRTLVMCGALDLTTPPTLAQQVAQAIPGARYEDIADSGHCPMLEQPAALVTAMRGFLG